MAQCGRKAPLSDMRTTIEAYAQGTWEGPDNTQAQHKVLEPPPHRFLGWAKRNSSRAAAHEARDWQRRQVAAEIRHAVLQQRVFVTQHHGLLKRDGHWFSTAPARAKGSACSHNHTMRNESGALCHSAHD